MPMLKNTAPPLYELKMISL